MPESLVKIEVERFKIQKNTELIAQHASEIVYLLSDRLDVSTSEVIKCLKSLGYINGWIWV